MEDAARVKNSDVIAKETGTFLAALRDLADNIQKSQGQRFAESEEEGNLTKLQMETLRSALISMDITAVNRLTVEYMTLALNEKARKTLSDIENHILMFDYDKAIEAIDASGAV
jgi:seryl-tRNA(Sec) selenium transferase